MLMTVKYDYQGKHTNGTGIQDAAENWPMQQAGKIA